MNTIAYAAKEITTMGIAIGILKVSSYNNRLATLKLEKAKELITSGDDVDLVVGARLMSSANRDVRRGETLRRAAMKVHADPRTS